MHEINVIRGPGDAFPYLLMDVTLNACQGLSAPASGSYEALPAGSAAEWTVTRSHPPGPAPRWWKCAFSSPSSPSWKRTLPTYSQSTLPGVRTHHSLALSGQVIL